MFGVSRQVYYRAIHSRKRRQATAQKVIEMIKEIRIKQPRVGTRKLYHLLKGELMELGVGRDRLFSILKANHMLIEPKRGYHVTTDSHHWFRKHPNLIEEMTPVRPEQIWVSDITYVGNRDYPMYLALITDAYSKKIVGFNLSDSLKARGALKALKMAVKQRNYPNQPLIHHSDRGFQYCCDQYQQALKQNNLECSMTESYDPYANAVAERINGIIKHEFLLDYQLSLTDMNQLVRESINTYNRIRPHSSCQMKTPIEMHQQCEIEIKTYKMKKSSRSIPTTL
ncbi:IS3 family transposase [Ekhidna sp.]|uniref:IS3 family transposase n=1 Tax=Ekhidna sp. TaxID=2608089 RepID=UPI003C7C2116